MLNKLFNKVDEAFTKKPLTPTKAVKNKFIENSFDWKETDELTSWCQKMEAKGLTLYSFDSGSDSYVIIASNISDLEEFKKAYVDYEPEYPVSPEDLDYFDSDSVNEKKIEDKPEPGKLYALTGAPGEKNIAAGQSWKDSEVKVDAIPPNWNKIPGEALRQTPWAIKTIHDAATAAKGTRDKYLTKLASVTVKTWWDPQSKNYVTEVLDNKTEYEADNAEFTGNLTDAQTSHLWAVGEYSAKKLEENMSTEAWTEGKNGTWVIDKSELEQIGHLDPWGKGLNISTFKAAKDAEGEAMYWEVHTTDPKGNSILLKIFND